MSQQWFVEVLIIGVSKTDSSFSCHIRLLLAKGKTKCNYRDGYVIHITSGFKYYDCVGYAIFTGD